MKCVCVRVGGGGGSATRGSNLLVKAIHVEQGLCGTYNCFELITLEYRTLWAADEEGQQPSLVPSLR